MQPLRPTLRRWLCGLGFSALALHAQADPLTDAATALLRAHTQPLGETVQISVQPAAAALPCPAPMAFLPGPARDVTALERGGRVTVGVRCDEQVRYLQAQVSVAGRYWVAASDITAGTTITAALLREAHGDLSQLPRQAVRDAQAALGRQSTRPLSAGTVVQAQHLRAVPLVTRRQPVVMEADGAGFKITREVVALDDGARGDVVRVQLDSRTQLNAEVIGPGRVHAAR